MAMKKDNHDGCPGCLRTPLTRRDALKVASNGFGMLALSALMADDAYAGLAKHKGPHFAPKAKNILFLYMPGAVSHIDTFTESLGFQTLLKPRDSVNSPKGWQANIRSRKIRCLRTATSGKTWLMQYST